MEPVPEGRAEPGAVTEIALVASLTFRDLLRRPGGWIATLLTAALFAVLVGVVGLSGERVQQRAETRSFRIAVGGDLDGARRLLDELAGPRFTFVAEADVGATVTQSRASAGIEFPPRTDERLDAGELVEVRMFARQTANLSVEAFNLLGVRLQEVELARVSTAQGKTAPAPPRPAVAVVDLPRDERLNRLQLARQLAPIAALLCIGVVSSVAAVLGAARERRSIEPLLVLPIRRSSLAFGIALGAYPLAVLQIVAAVSLLVLTAAIPGSVLHQPPGTLVAMLAAGAFSAALLALVATGFGTFAGSLGTGSDDAVGLGDLVAVVFVVAGALLFAVPTLGTSPLPFGVPILGQVLLVRDTVSGSFGLAELTLAVLSAVAVFAGLVHASGRRIDDERRLARAIR